MNRAVPAAFADADLDKPLILLATGGTAGHVFPAVALARCLQDAEPKLRLSVVTDKRGHAQMADIFTSLDVHHIHAAGIVGRRPWQVAGAGVQLLSGLVQAWHLLKRLRPDMVIGFGGYSSLPTMFAANMMKLPTMIHEQNARLGRANRLLSPGMNTIATAFELTDGIPESSKPAVHWTGNPVRAEIIKQADAAYPKLDSKRGEIRIFIIGGSQGASAFGDKIPPALAGLPESIKKRLAVTQQVRPEQLAKVKRLYKKHRIKADLAPFFTHVSQKIAAAHLIICRAGAATLAEITAIGRPAIFIPYPFAADDHQSVNAARVTDAGGGWTIPQKDLTTETLSAIITNLLADPYRLTVAARCAHRLGNPKAAENMAQLVRDFLRPSGKKHKKEHA